ncbi:MAG: hypothetical protein IJH93_03370 [Lachnospiraceae bacterium]|nr:hypothetical protein [Lachnospiraceae bacterium]
MQTAEEQKRNAAGKPLRLYHQKAGAKNAGKASRETESSGRNPAVTTESKIRKQQKHRQRKAAINAAINKEEISNGKNR